MSKCRYDLSEDCHNKDCLACVLDKIRVDVEHMIPWDKTALSMKLGVLQIIDKYKAESENT